MKKRITLILATILLPLAAVGQVTPTPDFEIAAEAVAKGEILPLADVLKSLASVQPGRVVEVELEISDGLRVYEVELVTDDGRLIEVDIDAATGVIVEMEEDDDD
ncbi:PepSY domain-containing protein [Neogemmobacter tilapiae]|uniref:PepSY domain-containing protein n=1 Tax=Neogemmobacter tilapiae TaxID=875041 RepID=A0A918WL69_9RHOB|nr:PepSY domain-containing protein [Gemmobacter tilapiae]GHC61720.1 hypothetical protein GCM10007315_27280 [Gemmobacter tilapiae]